MDLKPGRCYAALISMAVTASIPIEVYLRTVYEPDAELVGGEVEERNAGEYLHNLTQRAILFWFYQHESEWQIRSIQEQRTRLPWGTVRIPDISVWPSQVPPEPVFTTPQLIAIEVLSPDDRQSKAQEKIEAYRRFGVSHIWFVDPVRQLGWDCPSGNWIRVERFEVAGTPIHIDLAALFKEVAAANQ